MGHFTSSEGYICRTLAFQELKYRRTLTRERMANLSWQNQWVLLLNKFSPQTRTIYKTEIAWLIQSQPLNLVDLWPKWASFISGRRSTTRLSCPSTPPSWSISWRKQTRLTVMESLCLPPPQPGVVRVYSIWEQVEASIRMERVIMVLQAPQSTSWCMQQPTLASSIEDILSLMWVDSFAAKARGSWLKTARLALKYSASLCAISSRKPSIPQRETNEISPVDSFANKTQTSPPHLISIWKVQK